MATVLLSAAGAAIGGSIGGAFAGLSSVVIGRAVGATLGKVIDQRLMGQGSDVVETGRVDKFRLTNAGEGDAIAQVYGRMRVGVASPLGLRLYRDGYDQRRQQRWTKPANDEILQLFCQSCDCPV